MLDLDKYIREESERRREKEANETAKWGCVITISIIVFSLILFLLV